MTTVEYFPYTRQVKEEYETENGVKHGLHTTYYASGATKTISTYVRGVLTGIVRKFYREGKIRFYEDVRRRRRRRRAVRDEV
jgi:antitoxin component YwqK of YwqJK toxin-antitoxin module